MPMEDDVSVVQPLSVSKRFVREAVRPDAHALMNIRFRRDGCQGTVWLLAQCFGTLGVRSER
jgi:hypothetical protein